VYNGKSVKIIDTRAPVPDGQESENVFINDEYYLAIWDKSLKIDMGSAKQLPNGGYVGFIPHGMHELHISGGTLRELASDAYRQYLWSLEN
jgi:hypothetical protein